MLKIKLGDIAICTVSIPMEYEDRYHALYARRMEGIAPKKLLHAEIDDPLAIKQTLAITNLLGKRGIEVSGGTASSLSMRIHSLSSVQSSLAVKGGSGESHSSISPYCRRPW